MTVPPKGSRYWKKDPTWWKFVDEGVGIALTEKAPPQAVESFEIWKRWREVEMERFMKTGIFA